MVLLKLLLIVGNGVTRLKPGDRVMSIFRGSFGTIIRNKEQMFQQAPSNFTFEDAASFPIAYCIAFYSLSELARLQRGETVLINGGEFATIRAAIVLAQHFGATIFVTVSSEAEKAFLVEKMEMMPDSILDNRNTKFVKAIRRLTNNRGVDVVINSLSGDALRRTWHCVAPLGRFIELGQKDINSNTCIEMTPFAKHTMLASVDLPSVFQWNMGQLARVFEDVSGLLRVGKIWPI